MNNQQPKTARERAELFAQKHGLVLHRVHALATNKFSFADKAQPHTIIDNGTTYEAILKRMEKFVNART